MMLGSSKVGEYEGRCRGSKQLSIGKVLANKQIVGLLLPTERIRAPRPRGSSWVSCLVGDEVAESSSLYEADFSSRRQCPKAGGATGLLIR